MPRKRNAVILIHGMGEQMPMQTLRGFVEATWIFNDAIDARSPLDPPDVPGNPVWWKPDSRSSSYELYRITTRSGHAGEGQRSPRIDFFEFYWADLTSGNTLSQLRDWFMSLLVRRFSEVPANVVAVWSLLWAATLAYFALVTWQACTKIFGFDLPGWAAAALALSTVLYGALIGVVLSTFGDVARYVRAKPDNIKARREIRTRGLDLLKALSDSGEYGRIILVGHSLGTIIAYDLIKLLWAEKLAARTAVAGDAVSVALAAVEAAARNLPQPSGSGAGNQGNAGPASPDALDAFQAAQAALFTAMRQAAGAQKDPWLISDFVTLGSPLTHAEFLMAHDRAALLGDVAGRRLPTCPPLPEASGSYAFAVPGSQPAEICLHHAAPFAAVCWTNIHDPSSAIVLGDLISGPVGENFGSGIRDIAVTITRPWPIARRFFTHTCYWNRDEGSAESLAAIRAALKLQRP